MVQSSTVLAEAPHGHPVTAREWAVRITERWRASVQSIIEAGQLLIEAKAALPHGEFGAMCEGQLPFSSSTAQRLMAIARDNRLSNPAHVQHLPASWGTLYELTKLSDDEFESAVAQQVIRPDMLRGEAELIRPLARPQAPETDAGEPAACDLPSNAGMKGSGDAPLTAGSPAPAPMPSGGLAIAHQRVEPADSLDFFPTPPWATRGLIEHVFAHLGRKGHCQYQTAWEPACGEGHMAEPLREYFRHVIATDIEDRGYQDYCVDFTACELSNNADWIITNPPFGDKTEAFVLKALALGVTGVAMFTRLTWLQASGRYETLFSKHPPSCVAIFAERVPLHKERWEPDGDTMTAYVWVLWIKGMPPQPLFWIPPVCRKTLFKAEDRKKFGKMAEEGEAA